MTNLKLFLAAATGLAVSAMASNAHATAYAYGNVNFTNLVLSGLQSSNVSISGANVATSSSANYDGLAPDGASAGPINTTAPLTQGSDVRQSFSGPSLAPAQNTYTQALLNASGARGDAQLVGNLITGVGTGANDVAEGRLTVSGTASSTGCTSTGFNVTFTVNTPTTFELTFNASSNLAASTTLAGEFASASVSASFSIVNLANNASVLNYSPAGVVNASVSSTAPGQNTTITNPSQAFDSGAVVLQSGTYQFTLLSGAQERLISPVPEPASLALLGAGLAAVGMVRRRRA